MVMLIPFFVVAACSWAALVSRWRRTRQVVEQVRRIGPHGFWRIRRPQWRIDVHRHEP